MNTWMNPATGTIFNEDEKGNLLTTQDATTPQYIKSRRVDRSVLYETTDGEWVRKNQLKFKKRVATGRSTAVRSERKSGPETVEGIN